MAKIKSIATLAVHEAESIIAVAKSTVRPMEWFPKRTLSNPQWIEFFSACRVENEIREDVMFRAQYRAKKIIPMGSAELILPEIFNAALFAGPFRILAVDAESTSHTNKTGIGRPLHKKRLDGRSHIHTWSEDGYGYAEPINLESDCIEALITEFLPRANLALTGGFIHPQSGMQLGFDL